MNAAAATVKPSCRPVMTPLVYEPVRCSLLISAMFNTLPTNCEDRKHQYPDAEWPPVWKSGSDNTVQTIATMSGQLETRRARWGCCTENTDCCILQIEFFKGFPFSVAGEARKKWYQSNKFSIIPTVGGVERNRRCACTPVDWSGLVAPISRSLVDTKKQSGTLYK